jgi:hypothetical protein
MPTLKRALDALRRILCRQCVNWFDCRMPCC